MVGRRARTRTKENKKNNNKSKKSKENWKKNKNKKEEKTKSKKTKNKTTSTTKKSKKRNQSTHHVCLLLQRADLVANHRKLATDNGFRHLIGTLGTKREEVEEATTTTTTAATATTTHLDVCCQFYKVARVVHLPN